ncbi:hypothetical protein CRG98_013008 [Punica granatum]|uniref:Integrase catalytic domain-containing protein n=1 Tax=Punica granatum TaxID=22663 RepID=A0A2I0KDJ6_PUNGR|nr:hypothetical protein CRG98_013008 [Punica granatum]
MNGAVEAANKNIKKIIEKMTVNYKDWHEMLPYALLAYRTSIRTSTGATAHSLVYGMEAVLPIEVEIPSMRILAEAKLEEAEWARQRYEQLNLIDEKRLKALCHGQCYQQRMARAFNAKARSGTPKDAPRRRIHVCLTRQGFPRDVSVVTNTSHESSGHIHGEQRSQRSPNTSRHSRNTEKARSISGLRFFIWSLYHHVLAVRIVGSQGRHPRAPDFNNVPFPPTTLSSRAITFKGFLIILTLPHEVVVTVRGPIHRAQPPFHPFLLYRVLFSLPNFLSLFRACPGFGMFGSVHERLDSPLRSPTSSILHRAVVGARVPTPFFPSCRCCHLSGPVTRSAQAKSCDSQGRFPDSFPHASRLGNVSLRLREVRGTTRNLRGRGLGGFGCTKGTHGHLLATGAMRLLGPPEALGLFFLETVRFT